MGKASEIRKEIKPKIGEMLVAVNDIETQAEKAQEEAYQKGLSDAWEAARNVVALSTVDRREVFGSEYMYSILEKHTASEAIEKIRQYEQEKEELGIQGYFKKGDEVIDADGTKAVILRVSEDNYCQVYTESGCIYNWHIHTYKFHKTGRHFPEIAEVLRKMRERGEQDDPHHHRHHRRYRSRTHRHGVHRHHARSNHMGGIG